MTEVEIALTRDLRKMLSELAKLSHISREEAAEKGFREGLSLASASEQIWKDLNQKAGISDEMVKTSGRIRSLREQLNSTDTAYARANFESFETFNAVGHLLMLYNVYRADVQSLSKMAHDQGIEVIVDPKSTDVPGIKTLLDRYLFRRELAGETGRTAAKTIIDEKRKQE
ncbi:MAG: hypothetical protein ACUVT7_04465 [Thermoplasmata archaeon]